jgi:hypothetical protein
MSGELPRVEVQPVVRHLDLVAVDYLLLEDAVSVPQTIAPGGEVQRGHGVQEAGGQAAEATVSKSSVVLLFDDILDAETEFLKAV